MRNIGLIFKNGVRRNLIMLIFAAAATLLMIYTFYATQASGTVMQYDHEISVGVIDNDASPLSEDLCRYLTDTLDMCIAEETAYDSLADQLINREISAIIEIPQGMYEDAAAGELQNLVITTLDDYENAAFVKAYLSAYMQSIQTLSAAADGDGGIFAEMLSYHAETGNVTVLDSDNSDQITQDAYVFAMGFLMMMISVITVFLSKTILTDRKIGTYQRMQCSSIKPTEYIIGIGMFGILCCSLMQTVFTLAVFHSGEDLGISCGLALLVSELFVLFSVGVAIVFALCISSQQTLFTVVIGYTTLGSMLGGAWFPINSDLGIVSNLARLFPQYWLMDLLRNMPGNADYPFLVNICILALAVVLVYLISAVIFTRKRS